MIKRSNAALRRVGFWLFAIFTAACIAAPAPTTAPSTMPALSAEQSALLRKLETSDWPQRKAAADALVASADGGNEDRARAVIAAMLDQTKNPEAQARLNEALDRIDQNIRFGTSLITLHPRVVAGPCLVIAIDSQSVREIPISTNTGVSDRWLRLEIEAILEPKFQGKLLSSPPPTVIEAVDDHGNSLILPGVNRNGVSETPPDLEINFSLNMPPRNAGSRLAHFRTNWELPVVTAVQHIEVPDILTSPSRRLSMDGVGFGLTGFLKHGDGYAVEFLLDGDLAGRWHEVEDEAAKSLRLVNAAGFDLPRGNIEVSDSGLGQKLVRVIFLPGPGGDAVLNKPAKLIWDLSSATQTLKVPIEFTDLDLDLIH